MITNILIAFVVVLCIANGFIRDYKDGAGWYVASLGWFIALINRIE